MAYDRELADRLRLVLQDEPGLTEKAMFGGLGFLLNGNLAVSASSRGGLLLRIDPAHDESLATRSHVEPFVMRGRPMEGWLHVHADVVQTDENLREWAGYGTSYARTLPSK